MQTTLLTVAIAMILALVAALVGPLLIDWGSYRPYLEAEASRLTGFPVKVKGEIGLRLLPSPQLRLNDVDVDGAGKVRALDVELALGPLLRGEWRATELRLTAPQAQLGLDAAGHIALPTPAIGFKPDALAIERLSIVDGRIALTDAASGASVTVDKFSFTGEAGSLLGPFRGEGELAIGGERYPYRLATGRYGDDNKLPLRLAVDPRDRPFNLEAKGALSFAGGTPSFEGDLAVTRPAAAPGAAAVSQPWQLASKLKANPASALMENVEFRYGAEERGIKFNGVAEFKFGKAPRFDGVLSARQIDLDGLLGDGSHAAPGAAIRQLAEWARGAFRTAIPIQVGIGIDQVTLAGGTVQNLRGDISTSGDGWDLQGLEFRAPGFTQARLSGHLAVGDGGMSFSGPAEIESSAPRALAAWLEGRESTSRDAPQALRLRGALTLASDRIAVEELTAEFARKTITGRFAYVFAVDGRPSKLDAALNAAEFDFDAALGVGKALLAGSRLERPQDMAISADVGRAIIAGITARDVSARINVDAEHWRIDRLAIGDLGGAALTASGNVVLAQPAPQGELRFDVDAHDMSAAMALLARVVPRTAQALDRRAALVAPAQLHGRLTLSPAGAGADAKLVLDGSLGALRLTLDGNAQLDVKSLRLGTMRLDGKLTADDGAVLITMLGLNSVVAVNAGPGALTLQADGKADENLRVEARLTANGLDAKASGKINPFAEAPTAALLASIATANAAPLRGPSPAQAALPVTVAGNVGLTATEFSLADVKATIAGSALRGHLTAGLAQPHAVRGEIETDLIDAGALIAAVIGMPPRGASEDKAWAWPTTPFSAGLFGDFSGAVAIKAQRLDILPRLSARAVRADLRLGPNDVSFDGITGALSAAGRLSGSIKFHRSASGLDATAKIVLTRADSAGFLPAAARPPVTGALDLSLDVNGSGLSPLALIGSLRGAGMVVLNDGAFAGLDPRVFPAVSQAANRGLSVDAAKVSDLVRETLDSGRLPVKQARATLTIDAGQLRLGDFTAETKDAGLALIGSLDLIDGTLDAYLTLAPKPDAAGADIFLGLNGPVTAPERTIDVTALTGWLTMRAVDNEARRLKAMEEAPQRAPSSVPPLTPPLIAVPPQAAPALPAPIYVNPLPGPRGPIPEASIGPQR